MRSVPLAACAALLLSLPAAALAAPRVDANVAGAEALQTVPGIGPSTARRIVEERRRGPFRDLADLEQRVRGIGPASARRMAAAGLGVGARSPEARTGSVRDAGPPGASSRAAGADTTAPEVAARGVAAPEVAASKVTAPKVAAPKVAARDVASPDVARVPPRSAPSAPPPRVERDRAAAAPPGR